MSVFAFLIFRLPLVFVLDFIFGEPEILSRFHPVVLMGRFIVFFEKKARAAFPKTKNAELFLGFLLCFFLCAISFLIPFFAIFSLVLLAFLQKNAAFLIAAFCLDSFWGYQSVASRGLFDESKNVVRAFEKSIFDARKAVSRIVGRDSDNLSEREILCACVETVAEGTTDGVISPLFYYALGGSPLSLLFKAASTLDSMVGYKNERFVYFGRVSARFDDILNFVPARISAVLMIFSSAIFRLFGFKNFSPKNGIRIFLRDRKKHASPNSAQTESAAAGILKIRLGGGAFYSGIFEERPFLGDDLREIQKKDVFRASMLMYFAAFFFVLFCTIFSIFVFAENFFGG